MTPTRPEDNVLADALVALRRAEACMETPPHVEAAVLAAWDKEHAHHTASRPRSLWRDAAAVAAAIISRSASRSWVNNFSARLSVRRNDLKTAERCSSSANQFCRENRFEWSACAFRQRR
jgi:hypothetical protein